MGGYTPTFVPGDRPTYTATAAVTGRQVVEITATEFSAGPAAAGSIKSVGLALYDAAVGAKFAVSDDTYQEPIAGAAITAGARLKCGAAGVVVPLVEGTDSEALYVAKAINEQATVGQPVLVKWAAR